MKPTVDFLLGRTIMHKHTISDISGASGWIIFKGEITVDFDSSAISGLTNGWMYTINNIDGVTDSNTGQEFSNKDEIAWNGTNWTVIGSAPGEQTFTTSGGSGANVTITGFSLKGATIIIFIDGAKLPSTYFSVAGQVITFTPVIADGKIIEVIKL